MSAMRLCRGATFSTAENKLWYSELGKACSVPGRSKILWDLRKPPQQRQRPMMISSTFRCSVRVRALAVLLSRRCISSNHQVFAEDDIVLLRRLKDSTTTILTTSLKPFKKVETHHGYIPHSEIIGQNTRKLVSTSKGVQYCATFPTIEEYVTKVRRLVTPVYPLDAATIVSLLDIHVSAPTSPSTPPVEIFEAGTGHGSLTLQLCRAIHAANPPGAERRGAIIHSIDVSAKHSAHARKVVQGFRRGIYAEDVDFHVGNPTDWITGELEKRGGEPFLTHALLDLPGPEGHLEALSKALLPDGVLGVFCPSVTQIGDCMKHIVKRGVWLGKDMVVEFPPHGGTVGAGLRGWNVKYTAVRSRSKAKTEAEGGEPAVVAELENGSEEVSEEGESVGEVDGEEKAQEKELPAIEEGEPEEVLVCRPSVGDRIVGGGFFAIFRKKGEC